MPLFRKAGAASGSVGLRELFALLGAGVAFFCVLPAAGQTSSTITNLAQLTTAFHGRDRLVCDLNLHATVFACNTNTGVLIVQDASGAELLELDPLEHEFQPGDSVQINLSPCFVRTGDIGIQLSTPPLLDDDGIHAPRTVECEYPLAMGRHPVRVDWFNQFNWFDLEVSCTESNRTGTNAPEAIPNLIHAERAECYEGNWLKVPNFKLLRSIKTGDVTNFDLGFRTHKDLVGIRFYGYVDVPRSGTYYFNLRSDDGSQLWVGGTGVPVKKLGTGPLPAPMSAALGEPMRSLDERRLATLEGRVSFVSRSGKGLRLEVRSEPNSVEVAMADAGPLKPEDLLNAYVRVSGVVSGTLCGDRRVVLGNLAAANWTELAILKKPPGKGEPASLLTTVMQVQSLTTNDAARGLPVSIRGVVTAFAAGTWSWMAIQDDTRGGFVRMNAISNCTPNVGELWEITGRTQPGDFAPIIVADHARFLGRGRMPDPAHPTWGQLANGSMDVQWAELQGLVTGVSSNSISLFLPEGREDVRIDDRPTSELQQLDKSVVRIRGTLFAIWNSDTHEVRVGNIEFRNSSITVDKPAPANPFDAPEKTARGLFHFDARATPFQRVKVRGQATYVDSTRVFIESDAGVQVLPAEPLNVNVGDLVEAVGYPELSGPGPLLREALLRTIAQGSLPPPHSIDDSALPQEALASTRIRLRGTLVGQHREEGNWVLQMQTAKHLFLARIANAGSLSWLRPESELALTGIYNMPGNDASHFELLLNSPGDISIVAQPSWWTLGRLLSAVGILLATLTLSAVWIALLQRQVAQRTLQLQHEIREREWAERQHALEAERSRIARDLHDDLGSSLTEINALASTGQRPRAENNAHPALFKSIAEKARGLIEALDVIVWAVNPEDNSLQSLADYLGGYAREYLANSGITCRLRIPVALPNATLDGKIRHELLMVVKEGLNNIVRHADASEVELQMNVTEDVLEILIADNGKGFDPNAGSGGHGLKNRSARLGAIGGACQIESRAGDGTTVRIRLPLSASANGAGREANTTFG